MKHQVKKKMWVGDSIARYTTTFTGDPAASDIEKRISLLATLRAIADQPQLLNVGPVLMERMTMQFTNNAWVIEMMAENVEERPIDDPADDIDWSKML